MTHWRVFKAAAKDFKHALHDGAWRKVSKNRCHAMIVILCLLNSAALLLTAAHVAKSGKASSDTTFAAAIAHDALDSFSISMLAAFALMSFIGMLSLRQLRTVDGKARELPLAERKILSLLAANAVYQVHGIDATNACFAFKPKSGETKVFAPVPLWAVWRSIKVLSDGRFLKETSDGGFAPDRRCFLRGSSQESQQIQDYCLELGCSTIV